MSEKENLINQNVKKIVSILKKLDIPLTSSDLSILTGVHKKSIGHYIKEAETLGLIKKHKSTLGTFSYVYTELTKRGEKEPSIEDFKKKRLNLGLIIFMITLPLLIALYFVMYYQYIPYDLGRSYFLLTIFTFPVHLLGLGLIFFSLKPKSKGYFLIFFGLFIFCVSILTPPQFKGLWFEPLREFQMALIRIDIPIISMIFFGFLIILNHKKYLDLLSFLIVGISNDLFFGGMIYQFFLSFYGGYILLA